MSDKTKDSVIVVVIIIGGLLDAILNYILNHRDVSPYGLFTAAVGVLLLILAQHPRS